ncbi:polyprenyl synthetase family protein [Weeksellaceae bacterium TAE3-ERU29]|nr:polyprenyl synthetase family protein [Weeksellaceae bacterium TAE3-ERU29]
MEKLAKYQTLFQSALEKYHITDEPKELYEPINYILNIGGKRLRPIITLMGCDLFGGDLEKAIKPGLAIEFFHNFTLMHDDIMDDAPIRRGQTTVHEKYNVNTAILSGDALLIKAYELFNDLSAEKYKSVVSLFTQTALTLCEGQQYDMNFETQSDVTLEEYEKMILYKTGVLTACAFKIGALIADASEEDAEHIYNFGKYLGLAFQLRDDLLDVFGENAAFGKKHAGDIFENKKTILYIKALEKANEKQEDELKYWFSIKTENIDKVYAVEKIFKVLNVDITVGQMITDYTNKALDELEAIKGNKIDKQYLVEFAENLIGRTK